MMRTIAIVALPAAFAACATTAEPEENDPGCIDGKCDGAEVWKYEAGRTPWVTCATDTNRVTCRLEPAPTGVRATQAYLGKGDTQIFSATLTADAPSAVIPETFSTSDQITVSARAPFGGLGDVKKLLRAPSSGSSVTYHLPFDIWRVKVTNVGATETLILKYAVAITDAEFMLTRGRSTDFFGAIGGAGAASVTTTHLFPVTAGGKIGGYYSAGSINEPPQFTIDKPGCYIQQGPILTFDQDCVKTRELVPPGTGTGGTGSGSGSGSGTPPTPPAETCVAGTQYECDDAGERWTGSQCCVTGEVQCLAGSQYECDDAGEHWTGSQCCVAKTLVCVAGSQYECDDAGEHWTGSQCCLDAPAQCVAGTQYECDDAGERWTGSQCCLTGPAQCVAGTQYECDDAGEQWTGSTCCIAPTLTCTATTSSFSCTGSGAVFTGSQCCRP